MKIRFTFLGAILLAALLWAGNAYALSYAYDFSAMGYADSKGLEGAVYGVARFTSETGYLRYESSYGGGLLGSVAGSADIYISFSEPVNMVSFTAGDGAGVVQGGDVDAFAITLYEYETNHLLGTVNSELFDDGLEPEWYTMALSGFSNIGHVLFDPGNAGVLPGVSTGLGGIVLTEFSYNTMGTPDPDDDPIDDPDDAPPVNPVPEPATMLLLGIGIVALVSMKPRQA